MLPPVMVAERENYAIRSYAAAHGLTMSDLVRSALTAYLRGCAGQPTQDKCRDDARDETQAAAGRGVSALPRHDGSAATDAGSIALSSKALTTPSHGSGTSVPNRTHLGSCCTRRCMT